MTDPADTATALVPDLDPVAARRWQVMQRTSSPWLHEEAGRRMAERLDWMLQRPARWLHWSPLLGGLQTHRQLVQRYPDAQVWLGGAQAEPARDGLRPARSGVARWWPLGRPQEAVPRLANADAPPMDMLWANMVLHTVPDPLSLMRQWLSALAVDGFVMFSCLGPDTLRELRAVYEGQGWPAPMVPATDMHDMGDMLVQAGFAQPVMDMERLTLTYTDVERLLADLREWGRNLHRQRFPALRSRAFSERLRSALVAGLPRDAQGQMQITIELVYGHARKPEPRVAMAPSTQIGLQQMRDMLRRQP